MRLPICALMVGVLEAPVGGEPVLEWAPTPGGPWEEDTNATIQETGSNQWRVVTALDEEVASLFYRVVAEEGLAAVELTSMQVVGASVQIGATGTPTTSAPEGMVLIPAGSFAMGILRDGRKLGRTPAAHGARERLLLGPVRGDQGAVGRGVCLGDGARLRLRQRRFRQSAEASRPGCELVRRGEVVQCAQREGGAGSLLLHFPRADDGLSDRAGGRR